MPKDEAKNFLAKRKDPSGNANRKLTTILKFKVVGMEGTDTLKCQLTKVVMYGDQKRTNVVATFQ